MTEAEKKKKREEEEKKKKLDEEAKNKEYQEAKAAALKEAIKELDLVKNIFNYLREKDALTNDPATIFRIYRDCKDKAQNGLIWPKGDQDVEAIITKLFRAENVIRRL